MQNTASSRDYEGFPEALVGTVMHPGIAFSKSTVQETGWKKEEPIAGVIEMQRTTVIGASSGEV
jgi:hypothetical protein